METTLDKILNEAANPKSGSEYISSSPTRPVRQWFKSKNIVWVRDETQDVVLRDSRGAERTIKRYVGHNRGKDYKAIDWMAKQAREHKDGNEIFSFNTDTET